MTILIDIALFCAVRPFFYIVMLFLQQNKSNIFVQQETFRIIFFNHLQGNSPWSPKAPCPRQSP